MRPSKSPIANKQPDDRDKAFTCKSGFAPPASLSPLTAASTASRAAHRPRALKSVAGVDS